MGQSIYGRLKELEAFREEVLSGAYPQRSVLGPGSISSQFLRSKSITSTMLDVSELSAVASTTGALTVTGTLIAGSGASTMGYDPTNGIYLGNATPGSAPFRVTPAGAMTATGVNATGTISATTLTANGTGSIAGWTIDSAKLSQGNTGIGASGAFRLWSGNLGSPALSNFSVDSSGSIKSAGGTIGGMTVDSSTLNLTTSGIGSSGGYRIWAGHATPASAPFRVDSSGNTTASAATITGAVTASSGSFTGSITTSNINATGGTIGLLSINGQLTIAVGGAIADGDGSTWSSTGITLVSSGSYGDAIVWKVAGTNRGSIFATSSGLFVHSNSSSSTEGRLSLTGSSFELSDGGQNRGFSYDGSAVMMYQGNGSIRAGGSGWVVSGRLYPNDLGSSQTTRYLSDNGTRLTISGDVDFTNITGAVGAVAWSSRNFSADGGGYLTFWVGGTPYRVPTYTNS